MTTVDVGYHRHGYDEASDRALVALTRSGQPGAYAQLWSRHRLVAIGAARRATGSTEPDDLVSEAFAVILAAIRSGGGPTGEAFRPYLCATIRNLARRWGSGRREFTAESLPDEATEDEVLGNQLDSLDQQLVREAFKDLPPRWREVLWYTEVEGLGVTQVAKVLGLKPNASAALAFRAREALRKAWLQAHVADTLRSGECGWVLERIGEHSRDGLRRRAASRVDAHLAACQSCRDIALEVGQVNHHLARMLLPLFVGGGSVAAWLAAPAVPVTAASGLPMSLAIATITVIAGVTAITPPAPQMDATVATPPPVSSIVVGPGLELLSPWTPDMAPTPDLAPTTGLPVTPRLADALAQTAGPGVQELFDGVVPTVSSVLPLPEIEISLTPGSPLISIAVPLPSSSVITDRVTDVLDLISDTTIPGLMAFSR